MSEIQEVAAWLGTLDFSVWRLSESSYAFWLKWRDCEPFEYSWDSTCIMVNERERDSPLDDNELEIIDRISESAFAKAFEATGNAELATCVSDDFALLARAARLRAGNVWLEALRHTYQQERFPFGTLGVL